VITIVSNASMQKDKQTGFAWVIAYQDTKLWMGVGIALGMAEDMHSGQAEAFAMLAVLIFMQHYVQSYSSEQFITSPLQCFCDNLGLVMNTMTVISQTMICPNDATNDDRDIYLAIIAAIQGCTPFTTSFFMSKGTRIRTPNTTSQSWKSIILSVTRKQNDMQN